MTPRADGQRTARVLHRLADNTVRAGHPFSREDLASLALAQVRVGMGRRQRLALAWRMAYIALTGRRP